MGRLEAERCNFSIMYWMDMIQSSLYLQVLCLRKLGVGLRNYGRQWGLELKPASHTTQLLITSTIAVFLLLIQPVDPHSSTTTLPHLWIPFHTTFHLPAVETAMGPLLAPTAAQLPRSPLNNYPLVKQVIYSQLTGKEQAKGLCVLCLNSWYTSIPHPYTLYDVLFTRS